MNCAISSRTVITPEVSCRMRVFGLICASLIVLIHSTPNPVLGSWQWCAASLLGRDGLCRIAVPYFFLSAGYFLAGHIGEKGWWRREVNKRVMSLVVPYFLWIGIGLLIHFVLWFGIQKTGKVCGFPNPFYEPIDLWFINTLGINPFSNKIGILWFMRDLFALVVISPFLLLMLKHFKWLFIGIVFAMYGAVAIVQINMDKGWYNLFEYFLSLRGLCYFTMGLLLRKYIDVSMFNKIPMYFFVKPPIKYIANVERVIGIIPIGSVIGEITQIIPENIAIILQDLLSALLR